MSAAEEFNYGEDAEKEGAFNAKIMGRLVKLVDKHEAADKLVEKLEEELSLAKARSRHIVEKEYAEIVGETYEGDIKLPDGRKVQVGTKIRCHLKVEMKSKAIGWLNDHGHSNIVKRQIVIDFAKDEEAWANKFEGDMKKRKRKIPYKRTMTVAHPTLEAFVRDQLNKGEDLPLDVFGVYPQKVVKIK
jgi:hypothetical protein